MTIPDLNGRSGMRQSRIDVPDHVIRRILDRVRIFRWDAWAEPADAGDWRYGPPVRFMRDLCRYWTERYDWRLQERTMNARPLFRADLDGTTIQFAHRTGSGRKPIPLLIAHGWPYSFHSYDGIVGPLTEPEHYGGDGGDAFSVVIPSYPGYDFSGRPDRPMGPKAIALLFDRLMAELGYDRYLVHGGDWGAHVTSLLAFIGPTGSLASTRPHCAFARAEQNSSRGRHPRMRANRKRSSLPASSRSGSARALTPKSSCLVPASGGSG